MWIENSVTFLTVRHHEAPNSYQSDGIFNSQRTTATFINIILFIYLFILFYFIFFKHTLPSAIVFKLGYSLFYQLYAVYAEISTFSIKKCSVRHPSTTSWRHARGRLTPPGIRRKYPERLKIAENLSCIQKILIRNSELSRPRDYAENEIHGKKKGEYDIKRYTIIYDPRHVKTYLCHMRSTNPRGLISAFIVRCLDKCNISTRYSQNFKTLASICSRAGRFESHLVGNPEDSFSRVVAHI